MLQVISRRLFALCLLGAFAARADQLEYAAYYFKDNGQNQVATTAFSLAKTVWHRTMVLLDVELDQTTVPPLNDAVTGASRPHRQISSDFKKNRGQLIGGLEQGLGDDTRIAANYYFSHEVDYSSQAVIGQFTQELLQKNLTLSLKGQYTWDSVGEITSTGQLLNRFKETKQASGTLTQLLSPSTILRVGGDYVNNSGFLSDPYRTVPLKSGDTIPERHPGQRFRQAAWGEISQYLGDMEASAIVNYRYYWDDWGMDSHTLSLKLNKYVTPNWILSPEYRYYTQTEATFKGYGGFDAGYHTGDYKLHAFTSHNVGLGLTCFLRTFISGRKMDFLSGASLAIMYFHYFNDAGSITPTDPYVDYSGNVRSDFSSDVLETRLKFAF